MNQSKQNEIELSLDILDIHNDCSWSDIEKQYRLLVQRWHPDRNADDHLGQAQSRFIEINSAFKLLREHHRKFGTVPRRANKNSAATDIPLGTRYDPELVKQASTATFFIRIGIAVGLLMAIITVIWSLDNRHAKDNLERAYIHKVSTR